MVNDSHLKGLLKFMRNDFHFIEMDPPTDAFLACWQVAGKHLAKRGDGGLFWLKASLTPPFLEHLSFRLGNQLFFVRLEDVDGCLDLPGTQQGLNSVSVGCNGIPCLMPMRLVQNSWQVAKGGWGLIDLENQLPIDPVSLISDAQIEMTDWELLDFAVQVVRNHIVTELRGKILSSQSNPEVSPSVWFDRGNGPEWVVVQTGTLKHEALIPDCDLVKIAEECSAGLDLGHHAVVAFANSNQSFGCADPVLPVLRGHPADIRFKGLKAF